MSDSYTVPETLKLKVHLGILSQKYVTLDLPGREREINRLIRMQY
jgi:hypothetical protein